MGSHHALPSELIMDIVSHLDPSTDHKTLLECALVAKRPWLLHSRSHLFANIPLHIDPFDTNNRTVKILADSLSTITIHVGWLVLSGAPDSGPSIEPTRFPSLHRLDISDMRWRAQRAQYLTDSLHHWIGDIIRHTKITTLSLSQVVFEDLSSAVSFLSEGKYIRKLSLRDVSLLKAGSTSNQNHIPPIDTLLVRGECSFLHVLIVGLGIRTSIRTINIPEALSIDSNAISAATVVQLSIAFVRNNLEHLGLNVQCTMKWIDSPGRCHTVFNKRY